MRPDSCCLGGCRARAGCAGCDRPPACIGWCFVLACNPSRYACAFASLVALPARRAIMLVETSAVAGTYCCQTDAVVRPEGVLAYRVLSQLAALMKFTCCVVCCASNSVGAACKRLQMLWCLARLLHCGFCCMHSLQMLLGLLFTCARRHEACVCVHPACTGPLTAASTDGCVSVESPTNTVWYRSIRFFVIFCQSNCMLHADFSISICCSRLLDSNIYLSQCS